MSEKLNYLDPPIENLFDEITIINSNLRVTDSFLRDRVEQLKVSFPIKNYELIASGSYFRDLSQLEGGNNLFFAKKGYSLTTDNLVDETERILSYHSCITVSQAFEVFESFLKDVLTELIINNTDLKMFFKLDIDTFERGNIRLSLTNIQEKNNKGFIKAIRKLSKYFKTYESNNIWGLNMTDWFKLIAILRHIIVHQRQQIHKDFFQNIKSQGLEKLFNRHFKLNNNTLFLTPSECNAIVDHLFEYAYLIYKGLSTDFGLELNKYQSI